MSRPRLLDLFCCAGGASMGYHRVGFDVVGVDIEPQPHYPFEFHQADALTFVAEHGHEFDVIAASPPCQFATAYRRRRGVAVDAVNLIPATRAALRTTGKPYVIENVEQARSHLVDEPNLPLEAPTCDHSWQAPRFPPATNRTNLRSTVEVGVYRIPLATQQAAMGIDWMPLAQLSQAIPPAYTEHIGRQLMAHLTAQAAAA